MHSFKWMLLVAILGLWGTGTVWAEEAEEEAVKEETADKEEERTCLTRA